MEQLSGGGWRGRWRGEREERTLHSFFARYQNEDSRSKHSGSLQEDEALSIDHEPRRLELGYEGLGGYCGKYGYQLAEGHVHYSTKPSGRVPASLKARFSKMSLTKSRKYVYLICLDALLKERDASHTGIGGPGSQTRLGHRLSLPIILRFRFYTSRGSSQAGPLQGHRGPRIPSWSGIQAPLRTFSEDINLVRLDTLLEARGETYKGKARQWLTIIRMERTRPQPPLS
ncbi:hypothetical protein [Oryza sativa Japonica Group]|uniref:Uncharacterized protein n=1 Tax=Oryza sativa subsp. japonica TaxID=39947 RepID=Q5JJX4_ORYSJ|nr:hypothetical protein [Oryza sativa Japonica Group]BAD88231.1 hypothetical protein [Oryza sativa Japonica Group]